MRLAILLAFSTITFTASAVSAEIKNKAFVAFVPQTRAVKVECFPPTLQAILKDLGTQFGQPVVVTSGHRGAGRARRGSQHRTCTAADIRIPGVSAGSIAKYARAHAKVGGVGTYCGRRTGLVHVDIGPRRSWHHCGRRRS